MVDKIEVYIRNEKVVIIRGIMRPVADHSCTDGMIGETERVMPENDRLALNVVEEFAKNRGLDVVVHDICTWKERLKALLNGVNKTPTVIVGTSKIAGDLTADQLKSRLQSSLNE
jgi:hypothetical protein